MKNNVYSATSLKSTQMNFNYLLNQKSYKAKQSKFTGYRHHILKLICMRESREVIIHYSLLNLSYQTRFYGREITFKWLSVNLSLLEADFPIEKNFCQRQDKFLYGFHGNNHKPPHQVALKIWWGRWG